MRNSANYEKYLSILIFLIILLLFVFIFFYPFDFSKEILLCGDGTSYEECSLNKPYYCFNGTLIEKASLCGCPEIFNEKENSCTSEGHENPKQVTLKYLLNGNENEINFIVYEKMADYVSEISRSIDYKNDEKPSRVDFKLKSINEEVQRIFLIPLVLKIQNITFDKDEQARIAISIVQNIPYGFSNKTQRVSGNNSVAYSRYPYEVLYDFQGVCGEKSQLLSFLLKELGFQTAIFYNQLENHESVGIKCPVEKSWQNSGYCFVETSGSAIISDSSISYVGGVTLESKPEVMEISGGISLSKGLQEYKDAEKLMNIRERIDKTGKINFFDGLKMKKLKEKYGLVDEYNLE